MKIANCRCGRKAETHGIDRMEKWVACARTECWIGPTRKTEREAIKAWNKIMGGKNDKRN